MYIYIYISISIKSIINSRSCAISYLLVHFRVLARITLLVKEGKTGRGLTASWLGANTLDDKNQCGRNNGQLWPAKLRGETERGSGDGEN